MLVEISIRRFLKTDTTGQLRRQLHPNLHATDIDIRSFLYTPFSVIKAVKKKNRVLPHGSLQQLVLNNNTTLLDHCLKSLHNPVKHMNLPTVV